jgi:hypothetical protein
VSTITVTNNTDTAIAGEIDLRQAVAEASAGDTIVFAPHECDVTLNSPLVIAAGKDITIDGDPGATTGFGAQGLYANEGDGIAGQVIVDAGALLTLKNGYVLDSYLTTPSQPAGASGAGGVTGHDGTTDGQSGTDGTGGGNGAAGADSANVLGAIENFGALALVDENVSGFTYAGTGGAGGTGGDAGYGGTGQRVRRQGGHGRRRNL